MWVVLVVRILNQEHDRGRTHSLRQRIREIPFELDALFRDISTRDNYDTKGLLLCIQFVLFAKQPLSPLELYLAILAGTEPELLKDWHLSPFVQSVESASNFILDVSKGLVEIVGGEQPTVQFIHESVREFIQQGDGLSEILQGPKERFNGLSHSALARSCLNYIEISVSIRRDREAKEERVIELFQFRDVLTAEWPFLRYATQNIIDHAGAAQVGGVSQSQFLREFRVRDWVSHHRLLLSPDDNTAGPQRGQEDRLKRSYLQKLVESNKTALLRLFTPNRACLDTGEWLHRASILEAIAANDSPRLHTHITLLKKPENANSSRKTPESEAERSPLEPAAEHHPHAWETRLVFSALNQDDDMLLAFFLSATHLQSIGKDERGRTPMMVARSKAAVAVLIDYGTDVNGEENDRTILAHFVLRNDYAIPEMLLKRGAYINKKNGRGETALCGAASGASSNLASLLVKNGADIESKGENGLTPLAWAARSGNTGVAALLLNIGARTDSMDNEGRTPLMWATQNQHAAVLVMLLRKEGGLDLADKDGRTPLSWTAGYGNAGVTELLLNEGAHTDSMDNDQRTPLSWATQNQHTAVAAMLLKRGARLGLADKDGRTPLSWAARLGNAGVAALLLNEGAYTDYMDNERRTPLMWATQNQRAAVVAMLLKKGARLGLADKDSRTPLSLAAEHGNCHIIYMLLENGARAQHADLQGRTPVHWASKQKRPKALALIQGWKAAKTPQDRYLLLIWCIPREAVGSFLSSERWRPSRSISVPPRSTDSILAYPMLSGRENVSDGNAAAAAADFGLPDVSAPPKIPKIPNATDLPSLNSNRRRRVGGARSGYN